MLDRQFTRWEIPDVVTIKEVAVGYRIISISNQFANADIALHGAHVMSFQPVGEKPIIWLSKRAVYSEGKAIRGGIPICWPWFGDKVDNDNCRDKKNYEAQNLPAHGFARSMFWTLSAVNHNDNTGTEIIFSLKENEKTLDLWPYCFYLQLKILVAESLSVELSVKNTDETSFSFTGALHTYLSIGDIDALKINGLNGVPYIDKLSGKQKTQLGDIAISSELDNIYQPTIAPVSVFDESLSRQLLVQKQGSQSTVVWNPWEGKSSSMKDFDPGGFRNMVCIEAANTPGDVIFLQPQDTHLLATKISIKKSDL